MITSENVYSMRTKNHKSRRKSHGGYLTSAKINHNNQNFGQISGEERIPIILTNSGHNITMNNGNLNVDLKGLSHRDN